MYCYTSIIFFLQPGSQAHTPVHPRGGSAAPPPPQGAETTDSLGILTVIPFRWGSRGHRPRPFVEQRRKLSPNQGIPGLRSPAVRPTTPCQAICKGQRNGKSQSLTRLHNPRGQSSRTHRERTWSQRKNGRSALGPSLGTAPVGVLLDQ